MTEVAEGISTEMVSPQEMVWSTWSHGTAAAVLANNSAVTMDSVLETVV